MKFARLLIFVMFVCLWPGTAHAARSWWGWLEELSGPGPFTGPMYSMPAVCWDSEGKKIPCRLFRRSDGERDKDIKKSLEITAGWLTSRSNPRFKDLVTANMDHPDNRRSVFAFPVNATYLFRPHRSLDIGPGAGVLFFSGKDVRVKARFVVIPVSASWKFLLCSRTNHWIRRALSLEFQTNYILQGFSGRDFGSSTTRFTSGRELVGSIGVAVDLGEFR